METYSISLKEGGELVLDNLKSDFLLIPASTIEKMGESLYKIVGPAASVHLREIGRSIGRALVEVLKHERSDLGAQNYIEAIAHYLERAGFGNVEVKDHGEHYDILIKNPPSLRHKADGVQKCSFEAGLIRGALEAITDKRWKVEVDNTVNETCCLLHITPA